MQYDDPCFTLHIRLHTTKKRIVIRAFDCLGWDEAGRIKLTYEVREGDKLIFPAGQLYSAVHGASDSIRAKEHTLAHIAMHPTDGSGVDDDFYEGYTPEQIAWVEEHGEAIDIERMDRYCDAETGEVHR